MIHLPYPISANRYWRTFRNRTVRSKEAEAFKRQAAHAAFVAGWKSIAGPVEVTLTLHPKSTKAGCESKTRMDLDNCIKVSLDALNGIAYADDKQVIRLVAEIGRHIENGGLTIAVASVNQEEA